MPSPWRDIWLAIFRNGFARELACCDGQIGLYFILKQSIAKILHTYEMLSIQSHCTALSSFPLSIWLCWKAIDDIQTLPFPAVAARIFCALAPIRRCAGCSPASTGTSGSFPSDHTSHGSRTGPGQTVTCVVGGGAAGGR